MNLYQKKMQRMASKYKRILNDLFYVDRTRLHDEEANRIALDVCNKINMFYSRLLILEKGETK